LSLHDGTVEFLSENQDSWTCRVTAAAPAAPVVLSNAHWMWDDGPEDEYTPLTPSLEQFLTSFVLQETVFGCRNLATADEPTALPDRSVPLWLDGWYVFEEPSHSFWSVDSTLVADISGTRWVGWNGPDTPSAELGKLQTIRSWCRDRQCLPRKERRPVRAIARRPEALVAELLGLLANAASVRAGRRDGAKLAGRGTSVLRESAPSQDPDHTRANTASRALEPFVSAVQQRIDSAPPADEESSRVVLSEGAGLLLDARKGRLTRQVTCQAPSMAHSQTTIRTVPRVSLELGVVAEEDLDALSGSARALGRVELRGQPERDAGAAQVVRAVRRLKDVLVKGGSGVTRSSPRRCRTPQHRCGPVFKGARGAASTKPAGRSYPLSRTLS
ncbi:hypothetical protein, partial [Streptomyces sp. NPDC002559]